MKKILVCLLSLAVFLYFHTSISAQDEETAYEKAYKEYTSQYEVYLKSHDDYILRRSQYQSYKTLQAQQDAQAATVKMLQERDSAILRYLSALKEKLRENPGIESAKKESLATRMQVEVNWYENHKNNIPTAGSLQDLVSDSNKARDEYNKALPLIYEVLSTISDGSFADLEQRLKDTFGELNTKLGEIKADGREGYVVSSEKALRLDRWVFDANSRVERAEAKELEGQKYILTFTTTNKSPANAIKAYTSVLSLLSEGQQYLREAGGFLQEIIKDLKTAE